jgi:hypothetical protein
MKCFLSLLSLLFVAPALAAEQDLSAYAFPALGAPAERKVPVEWNRFYDSSGHGLIFAKLSQAFPKLTRLQSLGKSVEGRDIWCLAISNYDKGDAARKPALYAHGNIHGNEVQAAEVIAYSAWYLCHQYGHVQKVTDLLDHNVLYLVPTINPDGRDRWLHGAQTSSSSRSGVKPYDNDHDGVADEDDADDLDGDGVICLMRIKDPDGRLKPNPDFPDRLMIPAAADEKGQYTTLGWEGIDNDGDGRINEDPVGGYDMNRDFPWDWQPGYIQSGAMDYPFSLPETRAVSRFVLSHPNIAAFQSFHNSGGMILRPPSREGGAMDPEDDRLLQIIAQRGEKVLPFYRSLVTWKDLYTVWGGEKDWMYAGRGILSYVVELWTARNLSKGTAETGEQDQAAFMKSVLLDEGFVPWHEFNHPTYGKIEIGGMRKQMGRTPPSFLLEEECHRNMAFLVYIADQLPRLVIREVEMETLDRNLHRVWVTIENQRLIPTRIDQDVKNRINPPDIVSLRGSGIKVLSAGRVTDRFFKRVEPVERRPERVEIASIPGMSAVRVQFIVAGQGSVQISVDSAKGGVATVDRVLP